MASCGNLLRSALVAVVLVVLTGPGSAAPEKLANCCTKVTNQEIHEPILGYLVQKKSLPCVEAVIFQTEKGLFCSYIRAPWVGAKIREFRKMKANAAAASTPSPLLTLITSTSSPPASSFPSTSQNPLGQS